MIKVFLSLLIIFSISSFLLPSCTKEEVPPVAVPAKTAVTPSPKIEEPKPPAKQKYLVKDKKGWKIIKVDSFQPEDKPWKAIDGKPNTFWHTEWKPKRPKHPHEIQVDLGKELEIHGFSYLTRQDKLLNGTVKDYEFYVSNDKKKWGSPISEGSFDDVKYDKALQVVYFDQAVKGRFIRLVAKSEVQGMPFTCCAEINVVLER
ncbi:MAG: discoidin domain-containing protein [Lentisphaeraceae bacterium]|nr:discoidin domain-containing protein [Lentisphaeraceae bacterium]